MAERVALVTGAGSGIGREVALALMQAGFHTVLAGRRREALEETPEPTMDAMHVGSAVAYMASLPLDANVQFMTVMATKMPFVGRG